MSVTSIHTVDLTKTIVVSIDQGGHMPDNPTLSRNPRDLVSVAEEYAHNPSIYKKVLRSRVMSTFRRGRHAPAATAMTAVTRGVAAGLSLIPVPVVNDLLAAAWTGAVSAVRAKSHNHKLGKATITAEDKVKFELKEIGGEVQGWDGYRWKISHAIDEVNKQTLKCQNLAGDEGPCDAWAKLLAKRIYLRKRVTKLRASLEAVKNVCESTEDWLTTVEASVSQNEIQTEAQYDRDIAQLKQFAGAHMSCSDDFCMHSTKSWKASSSVPTGDIAQFFVKASGEVSSAVGSGFDSVGSVTGADW